jgi:hypothetical protein
MSTEAVLLSRLLMMTVLALLVFAGLFVHIRYVSSRPLLATFGLLAFGSLIASFFGILLMLD